MRKFVRPRNQGRRFRTSSGRGDTLPTPFKQRTDNPLTECEETFLSRITLRPLTERFFSKENTPPRTRSCNPPSTLFGMRNPLAETSIPVPYSAEPSTRPGERRGRVSITLAAVWRTTSLPSGRRERTCAFPRKIRARKVRISSRFTVFLAQSHKGLPHTREGLQQIHGGRSLHKD